MSMTTTYQTVKVRTPKPGFYRSSDIPNTATFWHRGSAQMGAWDGSQQK